MYLNPSEIAALRSSMYRVALFCRITTTPELLLWFGVGDFVMAAEVSSIGGGTYRNFGTLRSLPVFNQIINGQAERFEVTISGVTDEAIQAFMEMDADNLIGKKIYIGIGFLGDDWALLGNVHWIRSGRIDTPAFNLTPPGDNNQPRQKSISLSIGSLLTGRRRPQQLVWTDQSQRRRSPGDRYCERVVINTEIEKDWPRFTNAGDIKGEGGAIK